eukprot:Clim_evm81s11 gene=Clim_evmTU81s11
MPAADVVPRSDVLGMIQLRSAAQRGNRLESEDVDRTQDLVSSRLTVLSKEHVKELLSTVHNALDEHGHSAALFNPIFENGARTRHSFWSILLANGKLQPLVLEFLIQTCLSDALLSDGDSLNLSGKILLLCRNCTISGNNDGLLNDLLDMLDVSEGQTKVNLIALLPYMTNLRSIEVVADKLLQQLRLCPEMCGMILDSLGFFNLDTTCKLALYVTLSENIADYEIDQIPSILRFMFKSTSGANENGQLIRLTRQNIPLYHMICALDHGDTQRVNSVKMILDTLSSILRFNSGLGQTWLATLRNENKKTDGDEVKCIDWAVLVIMYGSELLRDSVVSILSQTLNGNPESSRSKETRKSFNEFLDCIAQQYQYQDMATDLLRGLYLYMTAKDHHPHVHSPVPQMLIQYFVMSDQRQRQQTVTCILDQMTSAVDEWVETTIGILLAILSENPDCLLPFTFHIHMMMEHLIRLKENAVQGLFTIMTQVSAMQALREGDQYQFLADEMQMLRKNLFHHNPDLRVRGLWGAVAVAKQLRKTSIDFSSLQSKAEAKHEEVLNMLFDVSRARKLNEDLINDTIASSLVTSKYSSGQVESQILYSVMDAVRNTFVDRFIHTVDEDMQPAYDLNAAETSVFVDIEKLSPEELSIMCSQFRLLSHCSLALQMDDLKKHFNTLDVLLGCGLDVSPEIASDSVVEDDNMADPWNTTNSDYRQRSGVINWIVEVLNAFGPAVTVNEAYKAKVIQRWKLLMKTMAAQRIAFPDMPPAYCNANWDSTETLSRSLLPSAFRCLDKFQDIGSTDEGLNVLSFIIEQLYAYMKGPLNPKEVAKSKAVTLKELNREVVARRQACITSGLLRNLLDMLKWLLDQDNSENHMDPDNSRSQQHLRHVLNVILLHIESNLLGSGAPSSRSQRERVASIVSNWFLNRTGDVNPETLSADKQDYRPVTAKEVDQALSCLPAFDIDDATNYVLKLRLIHCVKVSIIVTFAPSTSEQPAAVDRIADFVLSKAQDALSNSNFRTANMAKPLRLDFVRTFLEGTPSPIRPLKWFAENFLGEAPRFDDDLNASWNKADSLLCLLFSQSFVAMAKGLRQESQKSRNSSSNNSDSASTVFVHRLQSVATLCEILHLSVDHVKHQTGHHVLVTIMTKCPPVLDALTGEMIPFLLQDLNSSQHYLERIFKKMQRATRAIQSACGHVKDMRDTKLMGHIPGIRKRLETLILKVKAMMKQGNHEDVLCIGTLKHRNIAGEVISSQLPREEEGEDDEIRDDGNDDDNDDDTASSDGTSEVESDQEEVQDSYDDEGGEEGTNRRPVKRRRQ